VLLTSKIDIRYAFNILKSSVSVGGSEYKKELYVALTFRVSWHPTASVSRYPGKNSKEIGGETVATVELFTCGPKGKDNAAAAAGAGYKPPTILTPRLNVGYWDKANSRPCGDSVVVSKLIAFKLVILFSVGGISMVTIG
jgi:hypothetical protein